LCASTLNVSQSASPAKDPPRRNVIVPQLLGICVTILTVLALAVSQPLQGQSEQPRQIQAGSIIGTVTDVNGVTVALAKVLLAGPNPDDRRTAITNDNGFFEFHDVRPGVTYYVVVTRGGFADWRSPMVTIAPNQSKILTGIRLRVATVRTTIKVTPQSAAQVATEQVKQQEKQRILGIIPNFYVVYGPNFVPLTAKLKFRLAFRTAIDPVTFVGVAFVAGMQQAGDTPDFGQGAQGYAKRFGADYANGLTDIMIGGAILPSLLHQDPRYFYQGTGTIKSRIRHAISNPFVCKGDNGKWQPNYSSVGGDLASAAISNTYYPESNRGVGRTFTSFAINTGARAVASLAQEFLLHKVTRRPGKSK
jgi:Carboxypeptidase regulatory-like domain